MKKCEDCVECNDAYKNMGVLICSRIAEGLRCEYKRKETTEPDFKDFPSIAFLWAFFALCLAAVEGWHWGKGNIAAAFILRSVGLLCYYRAVMISRAKGYFLA